MLRIDHPCARSREAEPGADRGFPERQRGHALRRRNPSPDLSLGRSRAGPAGVSAAESPGAGFVTQLSGEDDGPEPGAGDAVDRALSENWIATARARADEPHGVKDALPMELVAADSLSRQRPRPTSGACLQ